MSWSLLLPGLVALLAGLSLGTNQQIQLAESLHPPSGEFVTIGTTKLHYIVSGEGQDLILIHGSGSTLDSFTGNWLDSLLHHYRVIIPDRPGHGYSDALIEQPGSPTRQAEMLDKLFQKLEVVNPVVIGMSWGASVAMAYTLDHQELVSKLILLSPYILPTERAEAVAFQLVDMGLLSDLLLGSLAMPVSGGVRRWLVEKNFYPEAVPSDYFDNDPILPQRPSEIRVNGFELKAINPELHSMIKGYPSLSVPVTLLIGEMDQMVPPDPNRELAEKMGWGYEVYSGAGHAIHVTRFDEIVRFLIDTKSENTTP